MGPSNRTTDISQRAFCVALAFCSTVSAQEKSDGGEDSAELAKKLSNPVALTLGGRSS